MSIRVALRHYTVYSFDRAVALAPHVVRLRPAPHSRTSIHGYAFNVTPTQHFINWQQDPFGNWLARLIFPEKAQKLTVDVEVIADLAVINPFDFFVEDYAQTFPFRYPEALAKDLGPYCEVADDGVRLRDWAATVDRSPQGIVDFLVAVNQRVQQETTYTKRMTPGVQSCEVTLARRAGSCRDSAWLLVQVLRQLGLAARFVSGYLVQLQSDVIPLDGPPGIIHDVSDLHAWTEVYIPGAGWIGLDPTSGLFAAEGHIPLAATPSPASAAPIEGLTEKCEVTFTHHNAVTRILETPRVSRPYSSAQWTAILDLGRNVDMALHAQDVRLTLGSRPTFVSLDHLDTPEWNAGTTDSPKYQRAEALRLRLRDRYAPAGLLQLEHTHTAGGQSSSPWTLNLYWRADGQPLWNDANLLAPSNIALDHTLDHAQEFAAALARALDIDIGYVYDAYEDAPDSGATMTNATQSQSQSPNSDRPIGCALPLAWDASRNRLVSGPWRFARNRLYLTPGGAPMGLRLPLHLRPWMSNAEQEPSFHADSSVRRLQAQRDSTLAVPMSPPVAADEAKYVKPFAANTPDAFSSPHTALCIQPRGGVLHVFFPPLASLEHFLTLLTHVESVSHRLMRAVVIEGYPPPADTRLHRLTLTPAFNVIEVDLPPVSTWNDLVATFESLHIDAQEVRLSSEKFMLDGRHAGTGGGHAITLNGATAADSPFLRRPDLLRSFITYRQHHPSLSYFFSGLLAGPDGPAPRFDERRGDQLYELETVLSQMAKAGPLSPQVSNQWLRHVLTDSTGSTQHTEFCIDNLYSLNQALGNPGEVAFRGFEMAPHARMNALQILLIRALTVHLWKTPYRKPLVDWGTALHDRFMLPHFLWLDLNEVLDDLSRSGLVFSRAWFEPFLEFRFPIYGTAQINGIELELRAAIEPWYAHIEGVNEGGTARVLDSSVERLQVQLNGATNGRYILTCNGRRVPLRSTGTSEHHVAGIRYRAWQPLTAAQSAFDVHTPLTFDFHDSWNGRSIGGCTYHAMHPGGRHYTTYPINAAEAEARRFSRFTGWGHTPPPIDSGTGSRFSNDPPEEHTSAACAYTLDLRRPAP